jgi:hypothetical protein
MSTDATLSGDAYHQKAVSTPHKQSKRMTETIQAFASNGIIANNISGNDSTITFEVYGDGREQWVSFYYQIETPLFRPSCLRQLTRIDTDDMGFGDISYGSPDRNGGIWILRRYG